MEVTLLAEGRKLAEAVFHRLSEDATAVFYRGRYGTLQLDPFHRRYMVTVRDDEDGSLNPSSHPVFVCVSGVAEHDDEEITNPYSKLWAEYADPDCVDLQFDTLKCHEFLELPKGKISSSALEKAVRMMGLGYVECPYCTYPAVDGKVGKVECSGCGKKYTAWRRRDGFVVGIESATRCDLCDADPCAAGRRGKGTAGRCGVCFRTVSKKERRWRHTLCGYVNCRRCFHANMCPTDNGRVKTCPGCERTNKNVD